MSFMTSIKKGKPTEEAHKQLLRFGAGNFEREKVTFKLGSSAEAAAGFEYLNIFQELFFKHNKGEDIALSGQIIGKDKKGIQGVLEEHQIEPEKVFGTKITLKCSILCEKAEALKKDVEDKGGYFLIGLTAGKYFVKTKTTFPKPGKLVEKFCRIKLPKEAGDDLKTELGIEGDVKKKADINTTYEIHDVKVDENLLKKDPARARLESRRDVTVKRHFIIDGNESDEEFRSLV